MGRMVRRWVGYLQVIVSNSAEAASRICWRCVSALMRPSRRIAEMRAEKWTVGEEGGLVGLGKGGGGRRTADGEPDEAAGTEEGC